MKNMGQKPEKPIEWYFCKRCNQEFPCDHALEQVVWQATREEPEEITHRCPHCESDNLRTEIRYWCESCGENQVQDDGDECPECQVTHAENLFDQMMDR
jgi:DNA-directed RNA polymerase subunit RPC12/RpoP